MRMNIVYTDKITEEQFIVGRFFSNHSMTVWEALELAGVDMDKYAERQGWEGWDVEALELEVAK